MDERKQIDILIRNAKHHEKVIERLMEHPQYLQYQEIKRIFENGQFIEQIIASTKNSSERAKQQASQMIQSLKNSVQQSQNFTAPRKPSFPNIPSQRPLEPKIRPQDVVTEKTPDEEAREIYENSDEEVGIDEEIEGIPDIENLPEFEEMQ